MLTVEELQQHRVENAEIEFVNKYPEAREAQIYEFEDAVQAEAARVVLLSTAWVAGRTGRVVRLRWQSKHRVLAIRS
jgi:hypothetical protein